MLLKKINNVRQNFYLLNFPLASFYARLKNKFTRIKNSITSAINGTKNLEVISPGMEWAFYYKNTVMPTLNRAIFDKSAFVLIVSGSYGDVFLNLALLKAFHEKFQSNIKVLISPRWFSLTKRFNYHFVEYIFLKNENLYRYTLMLRQSSFALVKGYPYPLLPTLHPHIGEAVLSGRISDFEVKKLLLGLSMEDVMDFPAATTDKRRELDDLLKLKNCRPGHTLVISFERNSMPPMSIDLKIKIIEMIRTHLALDILINESQTFLDRNSFSEFFNSVNSINVPGDYPLEFIEAAGYYLGVSHGLSALLGTAECTAKMAIIVDITEDFVLNNGFLVSTREQNSIIVALHDHICKKNNFKEFYLRRNDIDPTINNLISYFKGDTFNERVILP
jgi:hypothetical protein